jgi:hypothetical protein
MELEEVQPTDLNIFLDAEQNREKTKGVRGSCRALAVLAPRERRPP